jgi:hypothetical protein
LRQRHLRGHAPPTWGHSARSIAGNTVVQHEVVTPGEGTSSIEGYPPIHDHGGGTTAINYAGDGYEDDGFDSSESPRRPTGPKSLRVQDTPQDRREKDSRLGQEIHQLPAKSRRRNMETSPRAKIKNTWMINGGRYPNMSASQKWAICRHPHWSRCVGLSKQTPSWVNDGRCCIRLKVHNSISTLR